MDDARFETLYAAHAARVLGWCRFALGSAADAEDAAAETFARLLAKGDSVPDEAVASWLFTVSRRICTDTGRRGAREPAVGVLAEDAMVTEAADPAWVDPRVRDAMRALTPLQKQVVFLRVIEDLPFAQVARLTRRSEPAVRMACHRALKALGESLRGRNDEFAEQHAEIADVPS